MSDTNTTYQQQRKAEEKRNRERAAAFRTLTEAIVEELGAPWELKPPDPDRDFERTHPHIRRTTDGAEFWMGLDWRAKDRVDVHANWPKDRTGREEQPYFSEHSADYPRRPGISFAATKSPRLAARDIERRFLSEFLPMWEKRAAEVRAADEAHAARVALAERLAKLLKGSVSQHPHDPHRPPTVFLGHRAHGIASVDFGGDEDGLRVEVRCTFDELRQLVKLFPPKRGEGQR